MRVTVEQARRNAIDALDAIASGELGAKERREACEDFVELFRYIGMDDVREAIRIAQEFTLTNKQ